MTGDVGTYSWSSTKEPSLGGCRHWRAKRAQYLGVLIEISDIFGYVSYVNFSMRMLRKIIAKETEKSKRCTCCCSKAGSSASLALISSYSSLNARLHSQLIPDLYQQVIGVPIMYVHVDTGI